MISERLLSGKMLSGKNFEIMLTMSALALGFVMGLSSLSAQDKAPDKKKDWKSTDEYNLYDAAQKDTNPVTRVEKLDKWKAQFADTDFGPERMQMYLVAYEQANNARAAFDTANALLKTNPNHPKALPAIMFYVRQLKPAQPADLDLAEQTAYYVWDNMDKIYAAGSKPEGEKDDEWAKEKTDMRPFPMATLIFVIDARKDNNRAIADYSKILQKDPSQAAVSNLLARALLKKAQDDKNPLEQPVALYHFARAAAYTGPNALAAADQAATKTYLTKAYTTYHGSGDGLDQLLASAKTNAMPPADFKIKSTADIAKEQADKEAAEMANNPMIGLWAKVLRENLTKDGGEAYFDMNVKDALLPGGANNVMKFKGKIVSMTPATEPKEIELAIEHAGVADAKLVFEMPLAGKMEVGEELSFEGKAVMYTKEPFMITFDIEKDQMEGWTGKNTAPKAAPKGAPKGAPKAAPKAATK
jgi:hypothetical protein